MCDRDICVAAAGRVGGGGDFFVSVFAFFARYFRVGVFWFAFGIVSDLHEHQMCVCVSGGNKKCARGSKVSIDIDKFDAR